MKLYTHLKPERETKDDRWTEGRLCLLKELSVWGTGSLWWEG